MRFCNAHRLAFALMFAAVTFSAGIPLHAEQQSELRTRPTGVSSEHDFDFLIGSWSVQHRRLKHRLAHSNEWETFSGTCRAWRVLDGQGDVDDNLLHTPAGTYGAVSLRSFDPKTRSWSIWWLDSRNPHELDPPVVGGFRNGVGTFLANDTLNGRPIVVRYIWSEITPNSAKWQQAFSDDRGKTWETNWIMELHRLVPAEP